jgi:hypothetical protein
VWGIEYLFYVDFQIRKGGWKNSDPERVDWWMLD